jgi:hypothetical protein
VIDDPVVEVPHLVIHEDRRQPGFRAAPALFSMIMVVDRRAPSRSATTRATRSGVEPDANGTMTRTGPLGHCWAIAIDEAHANALKATH